MPIQEYNINSILANLPPNKLYFSIKEVEKICAEKQSVLRYWEKEFPQLKPNKIRTQRRYEKKDIKIILLIKNLIRDEKIKINDARIKLNNIKLKPDKPMVNNDNILINIKKELHRLLRVL